MRASPLPLVATGRLLVVRAKTDDTSNYWMDKAASGARPLILSSWSQAPSMDSFVRVAAACLRWLIDRHGAIVSIKSSELLASNCQTPRGMYQ